MKPLAIFTMARNERVFLPFWLRYYARTGADLHVLDHESDDGSTRPENYVEGFIHHPVTNPTTDDAHWMRGRVEQAQRELLREYRRVVYAEVDEILIPAGGVGTLSTFLESRRGDVTVTATGFDVCALPGSPDLVVSYARIACPVHRGRFQLECAACNGKNSVPLVARRPLLGRGLKRNDFYDKTLISCEPLTWEVGFHRPSGRPHPAPDPGLWLLHFHYADRELAWERLEARMRGREPSAGDLGFQNKYRDRAAFDVNFGGAISGAAPVTDLLAEVIL